MKTIFPSHSILRRALLLLAGIFFPALAHAHPGLPGHAHGFASGLAHPLTGIDHICAMVAMGLWAAQRGGRARWLAPLTFVSLMAVGGIFGRNSAGVPFVEQGIAASVLVLGILIAIAVRLPLAAGVAIVGLFALFHGYAHGAAMPVNASGLAFETGFLLATTSLLLSGFGLGSMTQRFAQARLVRFLGAVVAAAGVYLCFVA